MASTVTATDPVILGNYQFQKVIGSGGSGIVFLAENVRMQRMGIPLKVAIKLVWSKDLACEEARRLSLLQHGEGIVQLLDLVSLDAAGLRQLHPLVQRYEQLGFRTDANRLKLEDGEYFLLVMEYLQAQPLLNFQASKPLNKHLASTEDWHLNHKLKRLDFQARLDLLIQLARSLSTMHNQGMVHGDLNPFNVLVNDETGCMKLIDFGFNESNLGMDGWRTPEHVAVYRGTMSHLPLSSDVYGLGIWISMLLGKDLGGLRRLVESCCRQDETQRPTMNQVLVQLRAARHRNEKRWAFAAAAAALLLSFLAYAWIARSFSASQSLLPKGQTHVMGSPRHAPTVDTRGDLGLVSLDEAGKWRLP